MEKNDHDLLIELRTRMEDLRKDIQEIKDGTSFKIDSHEDRINKLEKSNAKYFLTISIYSAIGAVLITLVTFHILS